MKKLFINVLLSVGLALTISSCKSDYEKYQEMMSEASNSPVTELVTPDSLSFNRTRMSITHISRIFHIKKLIITHIGYSTLRMRFLPLLFQNLSSMKENCVDTKFGLTIES